MSIESQIRELQQRQTNLSSRRTRAEIERDNAKAKFEDARRVLKEEFGLTNGEEIKAKIAELEAERDTLLKGIEADLEAAGA